LSVISSGNLPGS